MHKRPDGFHEIASLFQAIDLCDRLFISPSRHDEITCTDPSIPLDETNYVIQALKLFRCWYSTTTVEIHIEKRIPTQAGFGGGSSNAATTLWALNELSGRPATIQELIHIGSKIGSDVPFFFFLGTAYCTGRGEILEPFVLPKPLSGYLAKPEYGLSTPFVYRLTDTKTLPKRDPQEALKNYPQFFNDLEVASLKIEPRLKTLRAKLKKQFKHAVMTGSGTAFFCLEGIPSKIEEVSFHPFTVVQRPDEKSWYQLNKPTRTTG